MERVVTINAAGLRWTIAQTWEGPLYKLIYLARRNPNATREEWPALWNSHSAFAGKFPGLRGGIKYSRYCNRMDNVKVPGVSSAHDGVAIAFSDTVEVLQGGCFNTKQR